MNEITETQLFRPSKKAIDSLSKRQLLILNMINEQGFATIEALAIHFQMTPQTIRRDINKLCDDKLVQRYHGGASSYSSVANVDYSKRKHILSLEKMRIAEMVAEHIPDHASLFINIGTTTEEVSKALINHQNLRVVTNNLNVAVTMSSNNDCEVIIAGGVVRNKDSGITGMLTVDFVRQFKVDFGIIGVSGIDEDGTLLDYDLHEVQVAQEIIKNSRKVFLVTDHTKFARSAMIRLADISSIDAVFTDTTPPKIYRDLLKQKDVSLFVAEERQ